MSKHQVVIIGNGMVGHYFIEQLLALPCREELSITVFCGEGQLAYDRVHLSEWFKGKTTVDLSLTSAEEYHKNGVQFHLNTPVNTIDTQSNLVKYSGGSCRYDTLVLATGSYPFVPPIAGADRKDCYVYRTIEDLEAIAQAAFRSDVGTVVGGGLLGLEAANALKNLGLDTHVVEFAPVLMAQQLDTQGARLLQKKIENLGVQVHTDRATQIIKAGSNHVHRMEFQDGSRLETDIIVFSAGIRPNDQLARHAGLKLGERGGVAINDSCETSASGVYAIGEVAAWNNRIFGLVSPGYEMARAASQAIAQRVQSDFEINTSFTGADMSTKLKLLGIEVCSIGDAQGRISGAQSYSLENQVEGIYKKIVVSEDKKRLLGAILVGDDTQYDQLLHLFRHGLALPEHPETLLLPADAENAEFSSDALPDTATVCSCHNVSKACIIEAVRAGAHDIAAVKEATKASSGCGGCAALTKSLCDAELKAQGIQVNNDICEHFSHSRQALFDIVRVEGITDFDTLISRHGKGQGCDICKPAAASIFASLYNAYILDPQFVPLQDTNDRFLGNIQKDGTYSVVPRIPGGEISADKLIVLGTIANQFGLYTKITGGQRVDLFGAKVHELPLIWQELIAAGFETGHAYGKSLRTVKSCVGTDWCRYGVQDSIAMAKHLENRYKGLRSPHKLKFAVSGCTRECAEAQSKDIGVIATENGWNLFVGGNGGMRPRHGTLFATDLDDETLVTYIDRILMFYVKTADRLQRTSVWFEQLDGGLAYLQQVVIEDSLGVADALEQQMQHVIATYECEWKKTLNDKQALKQFKRFVNETPDSSETLMATKSPAGKPKKAEPRKIALQEI